MTRPGPLTAPPAPAGAAPLATAAREKLPRFLASVETALRGKPEVVRLAVIALIARGHLLIEDVPGVGKTTLARALARSMDAGFRRIQFTSDLLPSDILGVSIYDPASREFEFHPGPIFTHVLLADEINRGTPKTQSALLEAMEEGQVSIEGQTLPLPRPFIVLATQNPFEYHGTFALPESELDRFLMRLEIGYPEAAAERLIVRAPPGARVVETLTPVFEAAEMEALAGAAEAVHVAEPVVDYILALAHATRRDRRLVLGVSPRGAQALLRAARARALLNGREHVLPDDVKALAVPVFGHRVVVREGELEAGERARAGSRAVAALVAATPVPL